MIEEKPPGHTWTRWTYDRHKRFWSRHCVFGGGFCTAVEFLPRGMNPYRPRRAEAPST